MDILSELPKEILHKILYFMSQKEAVRTSVLSKSWRNIWCTRPNLDFSDATFKGNKQDFLSLVTRCLQRYYDQRLCVDEFHLRLTLVDYLDYESLVSLLEKWIPLLTNMGLKKFCLSLNSELYSTYLRLPSVVFGAESLQDLHLENFVLDQKTIERIVLLKNLRSLRLRRDWIEDEIFQKIIGSCPLIETLDIERCARLRTITVSDLHHLKYFSSSDMYDSIGELCPIEIHPPSLETIRIRFGNLRLHKGADFRNLNELYLLGANLSWDHMSSCKFPSLKRLRIDTCDELKETELFIDAPNILDFEYDGDFVPSISFATTLNKWCSDINVAYMRLNGAPSLWFLKLNEQLTSLIQSEISLTIDLFHMNDIEEVIRENINLVRYISGGGGGNKHAAVAVETLSLHCNSLMNLSLLHLSHMSSILSSVFSVCRPRNINVDFCIGSKEDRDRIECLWKILRERESGRDEDDRFIQLWSQDLEEVSFEIKRWYPVEEWRLIPLSDFSNYRGKGYDRIRFALQWRGLP
ncbi:hypothetical protein MIMGU_mgv1a020990mg [Erythranthe guttata]|uniref:F-box domain-containing protein n=2 Tax=Erythranthe guttata TaxID=4155 RepID=A0A022QS24_ERYGU|nr:hypothetical protein MIMGU_mgv1a020990mg [Erythranthe guttata]